MMKNVFVTPQVKASEAAAAGRVEGRKSASSIK
jgi:hypothetical protein